MENFDHEIRPAVGGLKEFTDFLRSRDPDIVADMSVVAHDVLTDYQAEAREDWVVQKAARHPLVLAVVAFLAEFEQEEVIEDDIKDRLARMLHTVYGIPPDRSPEVFGRAEAIIWQDKEDSEYGG